MSTLRAEGLRVEYGAVVALHGVDLAVGRGRLVSVTGPSGAGKTSLLWALAGALAPPTAACTSVTRRSPVASRLPDSASPWYPRATPSPTR